MIFSIASGMNDTVFGKIQAPLKAYLEKRAKAYEQSSLVKNVFKMTTSEHFAESYGGMNGFANGMQPVGEGGAYPTDEMEGTYDKLLSNITWKNSFFITQEAVEDAQVLDLHKTGAGNFIEDYYLTREKYGAQLLIGATYGTSTSFRGKTMDCKSADGVSLFSTSHPSKTGNYGNQSNKFAGAFSETILGKIETKMQDYRDDNGEVLTISPNLIIIPNDYTLKNAVFKAIGSDKAPETSNNAFNYQYGRWNVLINPYLNPILNNSNSDKPFFIEDTNYNENHFGLVFQDRLKLKVTSDVDKNNDNNAIRGRARFVCGANDWRSIAVGGVTGGTAL